MPEKAKEKLRAAIQHLRKGNSIVEHRGGVAIVSRFGVLHDRDYAEFAAAARKAANGLRMGVSTHWMVRGAGSRGPERRELAVAHFSRPHIIKESERPRRK